MSTIWKVVLVLVIVGAVGFGWKYMKSKDDYTQPTGTQNPAGTGINLNSTTNASLEQDMTTIDSHINAVDQSSAQVEQSMSDKPVTQSE